MSSQPEESLLDISTLGRVGGQLGSNPAGLFENDQGERFYIKTLESPMLANSEWMAAQLYRLCGAPTLNYLKTTDTCQIATRWVHLDKRFVQHFTYEERQQAQQWLGVHAWTANWDAAGLNGDNQGVYEGTVLTLDVGGALSFRAQGDPKGKAFGESVTEIDRLRTDETNPQSRALFGDMSDTQIQNSIQRVTRLSDPVVTTFMQEQGCSDKLITKMLARKADLISQLAAFDPK